MSICLISALLLSFLRDCSDFQCGGMYTDFLFLLLVVCLFSSVVYFIVAFECDEGFSNQFPSGMALTADIHRGYLGCSIWEEFSFILYLGFAFDFSTGLD